MKKLSGFKKIFTAVFFIVVIGALGASYVALKKKCNDLKRQITEVSEELRNQDNRNLNLYASYQRLTDEERIMGIAERELDMVIADPPVMIISIDQEKINNLKSLMAESYE